MEAKKILALFFGLISYVAQTQEFESSTPLKSTGDIPEEFTKLSSEKYREDKAGIDKDQKRSEKKAQEKFYLESNFLIDEFLLSGLVIFNDPVSNYVGKVADELLKDDPSLRSELKFYTIKSPEVNAFATDNGIVCVTLGLLAQLENEAQLAYVISHEIVHFKEKHSLNAYVESEKIDKGKGTYNRSSLEEKVLAKSFYSKEIELEADEIGVQLYLETNYSLTELDGMFDVLQYAYLPFDDIEFDTTFLETEHLKLPGKYYLKEVASITGDDDFDDSEATHPNIRKRRKEIHKAIDEEDNTGRKEFLVSKEEFSKVRDIARFELSRLYLVELDYASAIYNSYMLLKDYPNNAYLEKTIVKALYGLTKYKNQGILGRVHEYYKKIEGASQQLYYIIEKTKREEFNTMALVYAWGVKQRHPDDEVISEFTDAIFKEFVFEHKADMEDYYKRAKKGEAEQDTVKMEEIDISKLSKYEKIKLKKKKKAIEGDEDFLKYAFVDLLKLDEFEEAFEKHMDAYEEEQEYEQLSYTDPKKRAQVKAERKKEKLNRRRGLALGIDKIVAVDPFYMKVDQRKGATIRYVASEKAQQNFISRLEKNTRVASLEMEVLDTKGLQTSQVDVFNDYAIINDWLDEFLFHEDEGMELLISDQENVQYLIEKYGTKYFMWTGVLAVRETKGSGDYWLLMASTIFWYTLPYAIYNIAMPDYDTYFYCVLFDIESGEIKLTVKDFFESRDRDDILNSVIYDCFHQMKTTRKSKKE
ncbi:MAG: hypothetical protein COA57_10750 [Flavobacteriales bacterium]|nr:MAG: hypothetical protein COA57_10750 [Flavobacteriales bacterium]